MPYLDHSNPTEEEIREELTSVFGELLTAHPKFLATCVCLGAFLANTQQVEQQLQALDERLRAKIDKDLELVLEHYQRKAEVPNEGKLDPQLQHLLSRELTQLEIQNGFNTFSCLSEERAQTYVSFIQADRFRNQLKLGRHWKDPGVPGMHGEYTHRIQWHLLITGLGDQLPEPVQAFMQIGTVVDPDPFNGSSGLWDALFDRNDGSATTKFRVQSTITDARSPESLTKYIVSPLNESKWPLLFWFTQARLTKRRMLPLNGHYAASRYVESKILKFGLDIKKEDVTGTFRTFAKSNPGILRPGAPVTRTQGI